MPRFLHIDYFGHVVYINTMHITTFTLREHYTLELIVTNYDEPFVLTFSDEAHRESCINYITNNNSQFF